MNKTSAVSTLKRLIKSLTSAGLAGDICSPGHVEPAQLLTERVKTGTGELVDGQSEKLRFTETFNRSRMGPSMHPG